MLALGHNYGTSDCMESLEDRSLPVPSDGQSRSYAIPSGVAHLLTSSGAPSWYAGGPFVFSMFLIVYAIFEYDFSTQAFLVVPKLHHNAAKPKSGFCNLLNYGDLVGARGFEPRTSCAQGRRATRLRYAPT